MNRQIENPNTGNSYVLDGRGCVRISSAADISYFAAQGIVPPAFMTGGSGISTDRATILAPSGFDPGITSDGSIPPYNGFWTDTDDSVDIVNLRARNRFMLGNCVGAKDNRSNTSDTFIPDVTAGPNWLVRDSQFCFMQDRGGISIFGASRASDSDDLGISAAPATIGIAAYVSNDSAVAQRGAWAFYADVQHTAPGAGFNNQSYGFECAMKNASAYNAHPNPYQSVGGTYCLWLAAGGDNHYGAVSTAPAAAAMVILKNTQAWNTGIVFKSNAIMGCDGITAGPCEAIQFTVGQQIDWYHKRTNGVAAGLPPVTGAAIRSDVLTDEANQGIIFADWETHFITNVFGVRQLITKHVSAAVNALEISDALTGENPLIRPAGSQGDGSVWMTLRGKGAGGVLAVPGSADSTTAFAVKAQLTSQAALNVDTTRGSGWIPVLYAPAAFQVGPGTTMSISGAELGLVKALASGTAPGPAGVKIAVVCGTNAGTAKIVAIGGTDVTQFTILDNIGAGVNAC